MLTDLSIENILFFDIETVPLQSEFKALDPVLQELWDKKSAYFRTMEQTPADVYQRAGIYAEFGKIVCISAGIVFTKEGERFFKLKSFYGHNEKQLLLDFGQLLLSFCANPRNKLCGHNIKEFDIPFVARRMIINCIPLPPVLHIAGKKPWEVQFIDTLELWKFGDYKHYTSLKLLTHILDIPSPKDDIDGSQVGDVYYVQNDIERIAVYCEKDVFATAQLLLRLKGEGLINQKNTVRATN
ncbi:MAG: 3'-5' exonuclease [Cytophagaceae bacterium]|jgi:predicted PolB exonuclease-like 3'-5' exonuclease|nr:3'-5' exonuclease [Cytophagaceae bacterium]